MESVQELTSNITSNITSNKKRKRSHATVKHVPKNISTCSEIEDSYNKIQISIVQAILAKINGDPSEERLCKKTLAMLKTKIYKKILDPLEKRDMNDMKIMTDNIQKLIDHNF